MTSQKCKTNKKSETTWQYFCRVYKDSEFRLAKYKAFLIQQKLHAGKWKEK